MPLYLPLNRIGYHRSAGVPTTPSEDDYAGTIDGLPGGPPLAHWRQGESIGPVMLDRMPGARHGTYFGGLGFGAPSLPQKSNTSVDFRAAGYAEVPHDAGLRLSAFTLSFWFRLNSLPIGDEDPSVSDRFVLASKGRVGLPEIDGDLDVWADVHGQITLQFQTSTAQISVPIGTAVVGQPHNLVIRADNTGFDAVFDGIKIAKNTTYKAAWTNNTHALMLAAAPWHFASGGSFPTNGFFADAVIDEVALYGRVLSDTEVLTLAQYNAAPIARPDAFTLAPETTRILAVTGNDTFTGSKGDLNVEVTTPASLGTATVRTDKDIDYQAGATEGEDSFKYRIADGFGTSAPAAVALSIKSTPPPGEGGNDGQGGNLVYQWAPPASWIDGVPLVQRSAVSGNPWPGLPVFGLDRWTDPVATAGSSILPDRVSVANAQATRDCCFNRAPTGHPSLEIYGGAGKNPMGISTRTRLWAPGTGNPRHIRVVGEYRVSHQDDPTTFKSQGLGPTAGAYTRWFSAIQSGGKFPLGIAFRVNGAGCRINWFAKPEWEDDRGEMRVGWGGAVCGTHPGFRTFMTLDINWNRTQGCEHPVVEPGLGQFTNINSIDKMWVRFEIEKRLCSPAGTPSNAVRGNTSFGGDCGTASQPGKGDGFTKIFLTKDIDQELGPRSPRTLIAHNRGTVDFVRTDNLFRTQSANELYMLHWMGGTGSNSYGLNNNWIWCRKLEVYHYPGDDI